MQSYRPYYSRITASLTVPHSTWRTWWCLGRTCWAGVCSRFSACTADRQSRAIHYNCKVVMVLYGIHH